MSEVKVNNEVDKSEDDDVSYTLRGIPSSVHKAVESFRKEIAYKRDRKYNLEQSYVEALIDWAESRKELQKAAL
jgi:hypothetical protein